MSMYFNDDVFCMFYVYHHKSDISLSHHVFTHCLLSEECSRQQTKGDSIKTTSSIIVIDLHRVICNELLNFRHRLIALYSDDKYS